MKYESFNDQTLANVLTKLFQAELKLPVARKLLQLQKQLAEEGKIFEELRTKIVTKYAPKDNEGHPIVDDQGQVKIPPDAMAAFNKDFTELLAQEFQIATNAFVCLDDLPELRFSVAEIAALEKAQLLID